MPAQDTVIAIFQELVGNRAERLEGSHYLADVNTRITEALSDAKTDDDKSLLRKDSIGFHLLDWQREAAFLVAISLFPERFTDEEIRDEIAAFLIHAPAHIFEAARLGGYSTDNIFLEEDTNSA
jgi:hypothetical protein